MGKPRKIAVIVLITVFLTVVFAACGKVNDTIATESETEENTTQDTTLDSNSEVVIWEVQYDEKYLDWKKADWDQASDDEKLICVVVYNVWNTNQASEQTGIEVGFEGIYHSVMDDTETKSSFIEALDKLLTESPDACIKDLPQLASDESGDGIEIIEP